MKRLIAALAIAAACIGSREESRTPAAQGAPPAEAQPAPIAPPAPIAESPLRADAGVDAQVGKDAPQKPDPSAVPPPAAQMALAEPPLMPDAAFRAQPPPPLARQPHFDPPVPLQRKLKNGARVLIVENRSLPLVAVDVRFLYGVDGDPKEKPGLAEFVSDMVDEGTKSRSAEKFAARGTTAALGFTKTPSMLDPAPDGAASCALVGTPATDTKRKPIATHFTTREHLALIQFLSLLRFLLKKV